MNIIKKFKNFFRDEFGPAIHKDTPFIKLDSDEMMNICQDLMDEFGFNGRTGKIYISLSNKVGEFFNGLYNDLIVAGKFKEDLRIPVVYKDPLLFRMEFSKPISRAQFNEFGDIVSDDEEEKYRFAECIEELVDRMEDSFPIELMDESEKFVTKTLGTESDRKEEAHRNSAYRIVRKNGNLVWSQSTQVSTTTKNLEKVSAIPNEFILAFKLKDGYEPDKKV